MKAFEESDRYIYDLTPDSLVLDCGGYEGRWTAGINERYHCKIHVFEPVKRFYQQIKERFEDEPNINVHNYGIGGETGVLTFRIKGDMTGAFADGAETECVPVMGVEDIFLGLGFREVALMKINTEGSEFSTIEKLIETGLIGRIKNLQVQWHDVVPNAVARFDALQKRLAETHEETFGHGWVWQNWRKR